MKISPHASIANKKTTPVCKDSSSSAQNVAPTSSLIETINNNKNRNAMSLEEQEKQQQQQRVATDKDANNNDKNTRDTNNPIFSSDTVSVDVNYANLNKNKIGTDNTLVWNNIDKDMSDAEFALWTKRRLNRIDSGFYSSASDEDAADKTCQCGSGTKSGKSTWPRRLHKTQPRKLSISRSQSWSSLDSDTRGAASSGITSDHHHHHGPCSYSPSASSVSSLSSLWSLTSSSRNNLSCTPSLDSLVFSSGLSSGAASAGDSEPGARVAPSPPVAAAETPGCESQREDDRDTIVARTDERSSEDISPVISTASSPVHSEQEPEGRRNDEDLLPLTDNIPDTRNNRDTTAEVAATVAPLDLALLPRRSARLAGRRHRNRDQNNNAGVQRGVGPHEFLPRAPGRLGDYFSTKGIVTFIALIVYTLSLMVLFSLLGAVTRGLKAAVGKHDLKEMRKSLTRSRRSRRTPATSG